MSYNQIHYACGRNILPGWLNVDNIFSGYYPHGFLPDLQQVYNCDLLRLHPFANQAFTDALCEDFIEHLNEAEAIFFLKEATRTMRLGGIFTISFPCWDKAMDIVTHQKGLGGWAPSPALGRIERMTKFYTQWGHANLWTEAQFEQLMELLGWKKLESVIENHFDCISRAFQCDLNYTASFKKV